MPKKKCIEQKKREKEKTRKNDESKNCERLNIDSSGTKLMKSHQIFQKNSQLALNMDISVEKGKVTLYLHLFLQNQHRVSQRKETKRKRVLIKD